MSTTLLDKFEDLEGYVSHQDASGIARNIPYGYFTGHGQFGTLIPVVITVRAQEGTDTVDDDDDEDDDDDDDDDDDAVLYLPGYYHSEWDGVTVEAANQPGDYYETESEAAYRADKIAESMASKCLDDDAKFQAGLLIEDETARIHEINKEALPIIRSLKQNTIMDRVICSVVREKVEALLSARREAFRRIGALKLDPRIAV